MSKRRHVIVWTCILFSGKTSKEALKHWKTRERMLARKINSKKGGEPPSRSALVVIEGGGHGIKTLAGYPKVQTHFGRYIKPQNFWRHFKEEKKRKKKSLEKTFCCFLSKIWLLQKPSKSFSFISIPNYNPFWVKILVFFITKNFRKNIFKN